MKSKRGLFALVPFAVLSILLIPSASAHVPDFGGGGDSLETAAHVHNPLKSWAIYDELHESGEAHYFSTHLDEGQRLRLQFFSPDQDFVPSVAIMGPGIETNDTLPAFVEIPEDSGVFFIEGERQDEAEYEPFTPASYYYFVDFDWDVTDHGDYFIAVFHADDVGKYGMAIGYVEEFTLGEWLTVPIDTVGIHEWSGQNVALILAPMIATFLVGSFLLIWPPGKGRLTQESEIWRFMVSFAGLLFIGGAVFLATQMAFALSRSGFDALSIFTVIFVLVPLILGYLLVRKAINNDMGLTSKNRVIVLVLGLVGLFLWAGMIIGPILSIIAVVMPSGLSFPTGKRDTNPVSVDQ
jgi:hypothetical protein